MTVRLIASDLDGTLLDAEGRVGPRTRRALDAAQDAGIEVVPVTARQPHGVRPIGEQAGLRGWALCGNGALGVHLGTGEQLFAQHLGVEAQQALAEALLERLPDVLFASVREGGSAFVAQTGYSDMADLEDHKRDPATMESFPLEEVLAAPSLKLVVRHAATDNDALIAVIRGLGLSGFEVTHSHAPFVEVMAEGVSKAWGLAKLCERLGILPHEVVAFGDAPNDVEMLAWAGHGVAVANAVAAARAAAGEVTAANTEDGVARVIERILAGAG